jgi:hypothetical protein
MDEVSGRIAGSVGQRRNGDVPGVGVQGLVMSWRRYYLWLRQLFPVCGGGVLIRNPYKYFLGCQCIVPDYSFILFWQIGLLQLFVSNETQTN